MYNKATRLPEIARQQVQKRTPPSLSRQGLLSISLFLKNIFQTNSNIQSLYTLPPPTPLPTFGIKNQNKGMEDILDIYSHCPYLLSGETTFQWLPFNFMLKFPTYYLEKPLPIASISEGELQCENEKWNIQQVIFLNVGNSIKREENMKWEEKIIKKKEFFLTK